MGLCACLRPGRDRLEEGNESYARCPRRYQECGSGGFSVPWLLIIVPVVVFVLFLVAVNWMATRIVSRTIEQKHRLLEQLLDDGQVPSLWRQQQGRRARLTRFLRRRKPTSSEEKRGYLSRLCDLASYVENTTLVADEETRETLLERLGEIQICWESRPDDEL